MGQQAESALAALLSRQGNLQGGYRDISRLPDPPPPTPPYIPGTHIPIPGIPDPTKPGDPGGSPPGTHPSGEGSGGGDTGPGAGGTDHGLWANQDVEGHHYPLRNPPAWLPSQATPFLRKAPGLQGKWGAEQGNRLIQAARQGALVFNPNDPMQFHAGAYSTTSTDPRYARFNPSNPAYWSSFDQFHQYAAPIQSALEQIEQRWQGKKKKK